MQVSAERGSRRSARRRGLVGIALLGIVLAAPAAQGAVFNIPPGLVDVANDGQCSLVEAFININSGGQVFPAPGECPAGDLDANTVNLAPASTYLLQTPGQFSWLENISVPVVLNGNAAAILRPPNQVPDPIFDAFLQPGDAFSLNQVTLDGGNLAGPVIVNGGGQLNLDSVTIENSGTGIDLLDELELSVSIVDSRFSDLAAGITLFGSMNPILAIARTQFENVTTGIEMNGGTLDLSRSGFAGGNTGLLIPQGSDASTTIRNVTFSGQSIGIDAEDGNTVLNNVTFAFNQQAILAFTQVPVVSAANSIFAYGDSLNCNGIGVVSLGYNLSTDGSCVGEPTDQAATDPLLGPLEDFYHPLMPGSPAISASTNVDNPCEPTDQRGVLRPQDGNNDGDPQCDIGAFELEGAPQSELNLSKFITSGAPYSASGQTITYSLVATNNGNTTLTQVRIFDPLLGMLDCSPTQPVTRQPGESLNCTGSYTVNQGDVDAGSVLNTATANALDPDIVPISTQDSAIALGPASAPLISMEKSITAGSPYAEPGDVIEYLLEMTNSGNVTLTGAVISDPDLELLDCGEQGTPQAAPAPPPDTRSARLRGQAQSVPRRFRRAAAGAGQPTATSPPVNMLPGQSFSCTGEYTITQDDLDAGSHTNTATATALAPSSALVSGQDTAVAVGPLLLVPAAPDLGVIDIGEEFSTTITAVGGTPPYAFSTGEVPEGFSISVSEAGVVITGTGQRVGRAEFPITVQDSAEPPDSVQRTYSLRVAVDLEIAPETLAEASQDVEYYQALQVTNGIPPYTYQADTLPPGLTLERNILSGVPTETGAYPLSIIAVDAQDNIGEAIYTLVVASPEFRAAELQLPDAVLNVSYSHQLEATSRSTPVVWGDAQGLPPGMELQYTGFFSGAPRAAGTFQVSARATNSEGETTVASAPLLVRDQGVTNATRSLPPGVAEQDYRAPLTVFGSDPEFDCTSPAGELPRGLVLDGCDAGINGIPTLPGTFDFEILVTDSATPPAGDQGSFAIRIADPDALDDVPGLVDAPAVPVPVPDFGQGRPGPDYADESLQQMAIDGAGNRYLVGFSYNGQDYDTLILKFDADGNALWSQRFDSGDHDYGYGIAVNPVDQGIYVSGYSLNGNRYEGVILSYDAAGVQRWERRITGGVLLDALYGVAADNQGVYVTGERYNGNTFDALLAAFTHEGDPLWTQLRTSAPTQTGYAIHARDCGQPPCPLIAGGSEGVGLDQGWLLALDPTTGTELNQQQFGQSGILAMTGADDGWVVGGDSPDGQWRITRLDSNLQPVWSTAFDSGTRLRGLVADRAGYTYAAGRTGSGQDALLALLAPDGQILESRTFDSGADDRFNGLGIGPEGLLTAAGERRQPEGNRAVLIYLDTGKAF